MLTTAPRGTKDILPRDVEAWRYLERTMREICAQYGYLEIRTPVFEHTELFLRGIGETTDVVEKEMYTFTDRGERSLTLRPENTASAVRSYVENKMYADRRRQSCFISDLCSGTTGRRPGVTGSSISLAWKRWA